MYCSAGRFFAHRRQVLGRTDMQCSLKAFGFFLNVFKLVFSPKKDRKEIYTSQLSLDLYCMVCEKLNVELSRLSWNQEKGGIKKNYLQHLSYPTTAKSNKRKMTLKWKNCFLLLSVCSHVHFCMVTQMIMHGLLMVWL